MCASWWIQGVCLPFARWPLGTTADVLTSGAWLQGIKPLIQKVSRFKNSLFFFRWSSCQFYCNSSKSRFSTAARKAALIRRERTYGQIRLRPEVDFLCHILWKPFLLCCADARTCTWQADGLVHRCYSWVKITAGFRNLWKAGVGLGLNCWVCFLNKTVVCLCVRARVRTHADGCGWVHDVCTGYSCAEAMVVVERPWISLRDANFGVIVDSRLCKNNIKGESQDISKGKSDESGYLPKLTPRSQTSRSSLQDICEITSEQENCSPSALEPVSHQLQPFSARAGNTQKVS